MPLYSHCTSYFIKLYFNQNMLSQFSFEATCCSFATCVFCCCTVLQFFRPIFVGRNLCKVLYKCLYVGVYQGQLFRLVSQVRPRLYTAICQYNFVSQPMLSNRELFNAPCVMSLRCIPLTFLLLNIARDQKSSRLVVICKCTSKR